jgi:hypothetical protein
MKLPAFLHCNLFGHAYSIKQRFPDGSKKLSCSRCKKEYGLHPGTQSIVPWDEELETLYQPGGLLGPAKATVGFSWTGSKGGPAGFALYSISGTNFVYEIHLPSLKKAQQIHTMLSTLWDEK